MFVLLVYLLALNSVFANGAPSTTTKPDFYDQRQVGTYNIRLNLKDLNIVAILQDDASDNDQDYYDYELPLDYTDVPMPTTTNSSLGNLSTTTIPTVSIKPKPIITSTTSAPSTPLIEITSKKEPPTPKATKVTAKTTVSTPTTPTTILQKATIQSLELNNEEEKMNKSSNLSDKNSMGDRIPVFVMQQYGSTKSPTSSSSITIVTEKYSTDNQRPTTLGKIHIERCPQGFTRAKSGECRKLRRPPLYALSRLTSNLASTFRRTSEGIVAAPTVNRQ